MPSRTTSRGAELALTALGNVCSSILSVEKPQCSSTLLSVPILMSFIQAFSISALVLSHNAIYVMIAHLVPIKIMVFLLQTTACKNQAIQFLFRL